MIRTQIYIPKTIHRHITMLAARKQIPMAQLVRDLLAQGIEKETRKHQNDLSQLAKLNITGGPKDLSRNMDSYLYEGNS